MSHSALQPRCGSRHFAPAAWRIVAAGLLLGLCLLRPARGQAQTGAGWSPPTRIYAELADTYNSVLISDPFGAAHLVWKAWGEEVYYYSRWDGAAWTEPLDIIARAGTTPLARPALVAAADGKLHLFWAQQVIWHSWAWTGEAAGSARAWSDPEAIVYSTGSASGPMDVKQDASGAFHVVYSHSLGDVYYVRSDGKGLAWSDAVLVSRGGGATTGAPRLDIGSGGRIHVVWDQWPSNGDPAQLSEVFYAHSDDGTDWSEPRRVGELAHRGGNILATEDGSLYLAWQAGIMSSNGGRFVQRSTNGGDTWGEPLTFSESRGQSGYPGMAADSQGTVHIVTGDGEYISWDGSSSTSPLDLRPVLAQTENSRLAIVDGNRVLVVIAPFAGPGLYYTIRQLSLAPLPTATLSASTAVPSTSLLTALPSGTASLVAPTIPATVPQAGTLALDKPTSSPMPALAFSVGMSVALVAGVVVIRFARRSR